MEGLTHLVSTLQFLEDCPDKSVASHYKESPPKKKYKTENVAPAPFSLSSNEKFNTFVRTVKKSSIKTTRTV